jgi:phosphoenolpyruvate carboxykinase (ATP)
VRVICARAYHALFMHNMLIRPTAAELDAFGEPDYVIYNAGQFPANPHTHQMTSRTSIDLSLERREFVILGTQYAGEMKKGVFTAMHYLMPERGVLSMHCSANLSGTGKTTLSADPRRRLIGDDEHCWSDDGVFNIEGGCYAKCAGLSADKEPEIFGAIRFGTVLENVAYDPQSREVNYFDTSITENTRAAYPIEFIANAKTPCTGGHPSNIIFLTCDASGVLPPVSRLSPAQAMYHFLCGYTARVAGTGFLCLFQRGVSGAAPHGLRRNVGHKNETAQSRRLADKHRLVGRAIWSRRADQAGLHAGDHRRHPFGRAGRSAGRARAVLRSFRPDRLSGCA